ncbi:hypothetical protein EVAR_45999_1 [Eumeta japonica]|uniref:Uncharacterized protein n=1 Tax=Eumeta variegata TaxID=151549 RepID=A0A4C1X776_EUMVA|nr:hypothetical protein EVAR_45999_1 [Eumeta japonica]
MIVSSGLATELIRTHFAKLGILTSEDYLNVWLRLRLRNSCKFSLNPQKPVTHFVVSLRKHDGEDEQSTRGKSNFIYVRLRISHCRRAAPMVRRAAAGRRGGAGGAHVSKAPDLTGDKFERRRVRRVRFDLLNVSTLD